MKKIYNLLWIVCSLMSCAKAQDVNSKYAAEITVESTQKHLRSLASVDFEGRGTGQKGGRLAAEYIANEFKKYGLTAPVNGSYFQPLQLIRNSFKVKQFSINDRPFQHGKDIFVIGNNENKLFESNEIVFIGYGIDAPEYSDISGMDLHNKVVMLINENEPTDEKGNSWITHKKEPSDWATTRNKKVKEILKHNPKMVLAINSQLSQLLEDAGDRAIEGRYNLAVDQPAPEKTPMTPVVNITDHAANYILNLARTNLAAVISKINRSGQSNSFVISTNFKAEFGTNATPLADPNILGYLEGTDKKDEIVVIGGHYDHDGKDSKGNIFFGADDNASGTTAVLELARAFSSAKAAGNGPRRSILFITYAAEEKGLLGSKFYTENPIFPLKNTVACINIDMIGRVDDKHLKGNHDYIHAIGSDKLSSELYHINKDENEKHTKLEIDYMYDNPKDPMRLYYRSDHYNFAKKGIPSVFYFSGLHPDYHTPADTYEKIDFPLMVKREKLAFYTAWQIANRDNRLIIDSNKE